MYGQTEATARMTYLPPDLAAEHPGTVGVPVPCGHVDLADGEVVLPGPNVMLGYASEPGDLALGRTTDRLHTGDLGRVDRRRTARDHRPPVTRGEGARPLGRPRARRALPASRGL